MLKDGTNDNLTPKEGLNSNILMGIIVVLLIIIAVMGFFLGKMYGNSGPSNPVGNVDQNYEEVTVKVIKDDRALNVDIEGTVNSLKELPSLSNSEFNIVDFSDDGVKEYMIENDIKYLPAIVFSTNNFDTTKDPLQTNPMTGQPNPPITSYLVELPSGEYTLLLGSEFDPFLERSDRGFTMLSQENYDSLFGEGLYVQGNENAKITWLEYSDLECSYCAKLYNDGVPTKVKQEYGDDLNIVFNHFPLSFHPNAEPAAQILECLGEQNGNEAFYSLVETAFAAQDSSKSYLVAEAVKLGANEDELNKCLDDSKYADKVASQMAKGVEIFKVSGTPGNVLINNETLEYEVLSGAYPYESFKDIIDRLK